MGRKCQVFLHTKEWWLCQGKVLVQPVESPTRHFFHATSFLLQRTSNCGYVDLDIWQTFSQKLMKLSLPFQGKQFDYLLPLIIFKYSSKNYNLGKLVSATVTLTVPQYLKILMKSVVISANVFLIFWMTYVNLGYLSNSVDQYFSHDQ